MIGIFGGTFDPVHNGHINLALEIQEAHQLDEVWFCPAQLSPHKLDQQPIEIAHRLNMLSLAIKNISGFRMLELEAHRPGPSYTIDTLLALIEREKENRHSKEFALIL